MNNIFNAAAQLHYTVILLNTCILCKAASKVHIVIHATAIQFPRLSMM